MQKYEQQIRHFGKSSIWVSFFCDVHDHKYVYKKWILQNGDQNEDKWQTLVV